MREQALGKFCTTAGAAIDNIFSTILSFSVLVISIGFETSILLRLGVLNALSYGVCRCSCPK